MTTQHTGRAVPPTVEWLIDELLARVTTLEIELAYQEHTTAAVHDPDASPHAPGTGGRDERRDTGAGGDTDE